MSSIRDVARIAGVSVATVSRALTTPEKVSAASLKKVNEAIDSIGYRPNLLARNFRSARSYSLLVLVPDITNPFFSQVINAIEDRAQQRGYAVLLGDSRDSIEREREYVNRVETRLADGIIQLRPQVLNIEGDGIPLVYTCASEGLGGAVIRIDNARAAKTVCDYLVSLGHRRIGVITGLQDNPHSLERLRGYRESLEAAGLPYDPALVAIGDYTLQSGQQAAYQLLKLPDRPTAVFGMSDQMAIGAIQSFQSQGLRIPEDISVAGFDDIPMAKYWFPGITTIAQPYEAMGSRSVDLLLEMIEQKRPLSEDIVLPTEFIIRKSTKSLTDSP